MYIVDCVQNVHSQNKIKENKMATEKLYTLDEVASELRVTKRTVYDYVKFKKIMAVKVGKMWKVVESELNYIKENGLRN